MKSLLEYLNEKSNDDILLESVDNPFPSNPNDKMKGEDFNKILEYMINELGADFIEQEQKWVKENKWRIAPSYVRSAVKKGSKIAVTATQYGTNNKPKAIKKREIFKITPEKWCITFCTAEDGPNYVFKINCMGEYIDNITEKGIWVGGGTDPWDLRTGLSLYETGKELAKLK